MTDRRLALARLLDHLPEAGPGADAELRIRAVLRPLVEAAVASDEVGPIATERGACPNCGTAHRAERTPYCSPECRDSAAFVRQFRQSVTDGTLSDPERQAGMGQALWAVQGGGYPRRQAMVPDRVVAQVIARHEGKCSVCGAPATGVDHTGSG
ncbi:MAG: hypothetical protein JST30_05340 [Armatimonadetes bacterium]|nr:hypothetical protein [Armatimonadota bacterium]